MVEVRDTPHGRQPRLLPIVLILGTVSALLQVVVGRPQPLASALSLAIAVGCLWSALAALRGRRISAGVRIAITAAFQISLLTQLGLLFFGHPAASGGGGELAAVLGWAPVVLITT